MTPKIYVAGPLGFSEAGLFFYYQKLLPAIKETGYEIFDPWIHGPTDKIENIKKIENELKLSQVRKTWKEINQEIGMNNINALDKVDGLVAILDGPDIDSGTAAEIGYFCGKHNSGRPIIGYRSDFRLSSENIGGIVNIQVEQFIYLTNGTIVTNIEELKRELRSWKI